MTPAGLIAEAAQREVTSTGERRHRRGTEGGLRRRTAWSPSTPTTRWPTSRSSRRSRSASCAAAATSSSARRSTASSAPTPASTSNIERVRRPPARGLRPLRPAHPRRPAPSRRRGGRGHHLRHVRAAMAPGSHRRGHRLRQASPPSPTLVGTEDAQAQSPQVTEVCCRPTELASAAELVMLSGSPPPWCGASRPNGFW